jgi:hypothetical protein
MPSTAASGRISCAVKSATPKKISTAPMPMKAAPARTARAPHPVGEREEAEQRQRG